MEAAIAFQVGIAKEDRLSNNILAQQTEELSSSWWGRKLTTELCVLFVD